MRRTSLILAAVLAGCSATAPLVTSTPPATTAPASTSSTAAPDDEWPAARMGHAMVALDDGRLLVFGGRSYQGSAEVFLDDTWLFDTAASTWRRVDKPGPQARTQHAMAFDPNRNQVLVFGGYVGSSFTYGDTWAFDVVTEEWRRIEPAESPSARAGSVMVFDEAADVFVMFAGAEEPPAAELPLAETWVFDPDETTWARVEGEVAPVLVSEGHPTLFELAMVYDTDAKRAVLMVAGESTWAFSPSAGWSELDAAQTQGLGADYMTAAAYDEGEGRTIAYGGAPVERTQRTWQYDAARDSWSVLAGEVPGPLANHAMAYDRASDSVHLFGGASAVLVLDGVPPVTNDMWVLDATRWRQVPR